MTFDSTLPIEPQHNTTLFFIHALKTIFIVSLLIIITLFTISFFIEQVADSIPIQWEQKMAKPLNRHLSALSFDHPKVDQLQDLLDHLVAQDPHFPYSKIKVIILDQDQENAYASLGGQLMITRKLLERASSENEIAFILAHELGHHKYRHPLKSLGTTLLWSLLWSNVHESTVASGSISDLTMQSNSRAYEREADLYAAQLIYRHYGHLAGIFEFFHRHQKHQHWSDQWTSSHPLSTERIQKLKSLAQKSSWPTNGPISPWLYDE